MSRNASPRRLHRTHSVTIAMDLSERLRGLRHAHEMSMSSVIDIALRAYIANDDDAMLATKLRASGATLRAQVGKV